jgi:3-oxosteroid 1-dehydrogenase
VEGPVAGADRDERPGEGSDAPWRTADLVVAGSGAAGLTGALVAAIGGARVVVLEKASVVGGTTARSGGGAWIPANPHAAEVGVEDSPEDALTYLRACTGGAGDDDLLVALVEHGADMVRLLEREGGLTFQTWPSVGGTIDYRPWLPGARHGGRTVEVTGTSLAELGEWADRVHVEAAQRSDSNLLDYYATQAHLRPLPAAAASGAAPRAASDTCWRGTGLVLQLLRGCLARGVEVHVSTPVGRILVADGRVVGVEAEHEGETVEVRAPHLLLATGGYTHNEELKRLWLSRAVDATCDAPTNEGDGHLMGAAVGAQLAGLGDAWWMPHVPAGPGDGLVGATGTREDRILPHTMMVNGRGRRFMDEAVNYYDAGEAFGPITGAAPRNFPAWLLFDQQGVDRYAVLAWKVRAGDRPEWLHVADTFEELAVSIGVDPVALVASVARFNGFARSGVDEDFHRGEDAWDLAWGDPDNEPNPCLGTLERPPFYATSVLPGATSTRGGLRVDARARVLSAATGAPIPGLYAAGNCSNGGAAGAYAGPGATIGPAMTFGYLAGREVADPGAVET